MFYVYLQFFTGLFRLPTWNFRLNSLAFANLLGHFPFYSRFHLPIRLFPTEKPFRVCPRINCFWEITPNLLLFNAQITVCCFWVRFLSSCFAKNGFSYSNVTQNRPPISLSWAFVYARIAETNLAHNPSTKISCHLVDVSCPKAKWHN